MSSQQRVLFAIAVILGAIYIALIPLKPYSLSFVLKPIPMLIYAWLMWAAFPSWIGRVLAIGFIGAAFGDFFLDFGERDGLFKQALLAFLFNQIAFAVAFFTLAKHKPMHWLRSAPAISYGILLALWIVPITGTLMIPISLYLMCLIVMAVFAARVEPKLGPLWCGAMLFVLADSLIGITKFVEPFPHAILIIVTCYFSGQSLIAWGLLQHSRALKS